LDLIQLLATVYPPRVSVHQRSSKLAILALGEILRKHPSKSPHVGVARTRLRQQLRVAFLRRVEHQAHLPRVEHNLPTRIRRRAQRRNTGLGLRRSMQKLRLRLHLRRCPI
jgi:hypothetical protein